MMLFSLSKNVMAEYKKMLVIFRSVQGTRGESVRNKGAKEHTKGWSKDLVTFLSLLVLHQEMEQNHSRQHKPFLE